MPDEAITAPSADATLDAPAADTPITTDPAAGGQVETTQTPDDAEQGYLRHADYTRKTQELAQQRQEFEAQQAEADQFRQLVENALVQQDEDAAQELLQNLGYEFEDDGQPVDHETAELRSQLNELNEWKQQQESEAQARDNAMHIQNEFERLGLGAWTSDNPVHDAVLALAFAHESGEGPTDVAKGFEEFKRVQDKIIEDYKQSKIAPSSDSFGSPASVANDNNASLDDRAMAAINRNFFGA